MALSISPPSNPWQHASQSPPINRRFNRIGQSIQIGFAAGGVVDRGACFQSGPGQQGAEGGGVVEEAVAVGGEYLSVGREGAFGTAVGALVSKGPGSQICERLAINANSIQVCTTDCPLRASWSTAAPGHVHHFTTPATPLPTSPNPAPLQPHRPGDPDRLRGERGSRPGCWLPVRPRPARR